MARIWLYSLVSVVAVSLLSLIGVFTLTVKEKRLRGLLMYLVSFSAGAMLGDVFIHLLPEVFEKAKISLQVSLFVLIGIVSTFVLEKSIHWHHAQVETKSRRLHPVTFLTLFGDGVHNFIDGVILGASYLANIPAGIATTIAIVFHEIPQEIGNFAVLVHGGFSKSKALFYNFLSALTAVLGTVLVLYFGSQLANASIFLISYTSGAFIYIAGSDLIPELHKEVAFKKSLSQFLSLVLGIVVMLSLLLLEK
ncbi:ZIP family metal transporter [Candidatus Roizmanbacteria bacterium]|nr:ZIP family metal transporter [Candidatus Roizmanbacteria bacterium]